jgi:hypothetical protein
MTLIVGSRAINATQRLRRREDDLLDAAKNAVTRAIVAGEALLSAKAQIEANRYGQWGKWLKANCVVSPRTAQLYMQIAEHKLQIEGVLRDTSATVAAYRSRFVYVILRVVEVRNVLEIVEEIAEGKNRATSEGV